ncbi:MAG: hypothetical protein HZB14_00305, partial [Actinobacteria bacterium]|nr:hypothetical protein [Actinomycetota bacterium]
MNLRLLGRARLRVCLLVVVAASAASLLAAPAASASSFAALLSGSQAGSDQNQNLVWVNSAGSPDVSLRFESALGYWPHMHKIGGRCGSDTARTAGCPASSRIATVAATFSAPGSLPVVRTGYLALADSLSGELRGHDVLLVLDQNSRYKVTVKPIRVELKRVSGQPAAVLDIGTAPRMELASGAVSPARLSALAISGQQRWMRNPTACGTGASITAVATFADGSSESIRRTPNVTGCGSLDFDQPVEVMFNPREYTITKKSNPFEYTHPRATGFNLRVGLGEHADGERVTDARSMRVWVPGKPKYEDIARLPVCDEQAALANACPVGSQVGEFCVEIGPSRETACGALRAKGIIRNTGTGGGKIELLATLSKGGGGGGGGGGAGGVIWVGQASIEESVGNGGVVNGGVVIVLDGLPQADAHAFRLVGDNPLYESSGSCGSNPLHGDLAGWSGAARDMTGVLAVACTPGIETTDAADSDLDGDGIADDPLRPADFDVEFAITDNGDGIDWASVGCQFKGWDGTIKGSTRVDDTDGDGRPDVCRAIRSPSGAGTIEIAASDLDGHVTVLKLGFTVDSDPPAIAIDEPGVHVFDEFPTLFFDVVEEHPGSSLCELISEDEPAGVVFASACSYIDRQTGEICDPGDSSSGDGCKRAFVIPHLIEKSGRYRATITHTDAVGNKGTTSFPFVVDRDPPVLATTNTADADRDGDGFADQRFRPAFFDVFFSATDDGFGVDWVQNTCAVRLLGGALPGGAILSARLVDLDGDGRSDVCRIENAPEGDVEVSISIADGGGHVTVLKLAFTVDTTPPSIAIDEPGVHITGDPDFDLWTALAVTIDGKTDAADLTGYSCKILLEADLDGDGEYEPISHMATGCGGGGGGSGGSLRVLPTVNKITLEVGDAAGNTSSRVIDVYLDADPPSIAIDESGVHITGDPDFDLLFTTDDNSL